MDNETTSTEQLQTEISRERDKAIARAEEAETALARCVGELREARKGQTTRSDGILVELEHPEDPESEIAAALGLVDLHAILRSQVLGDHGDQIWVYMRESDGTPAGGHCITGSSETPGDIYKGESGPVARLTAVGVGNADSTYYSDGWAREDEDGLYRVATGKLIGDGSTEDMIALALKEGDFSGELDDLREEIVRQWREDLETED